MASITRRSIMVVEARMRMIARNSTNLIEVLVVGMVSRRERDSRRDVRNMAVEAGLAVDLKAEREFQKRGVRNMAVEADLAVDLKAERELQKRDVRNMAVEVASEVGSKNLLVSASRNQERNMAIVEVSVADTRNLVDKNTAEGDLEAAVLRMKLGGVRASGKRSIERKLLKSEKRSARRSIEKRDEKRVAVDGFLDWLWIRMVWCSS
jgi:hypothetical protein